MEQLETKNIDIVRLFLQKVEVLNETERAILIKTIEIINTPLFVTNTL